MKEQIISIFDQISSGYDRPEMRYFPYSADYMLGLAKPKSGDKVLDVATGTAMVAIAAAQYVRPGGRVQAIDLSEGMLAKARLNIDKHALDNIDIHNMDAENIEFRSGYFDLITCGFGVFFLSDAKTAVQNWRRVLKPGGRVIISTFAESAFMPMAGWFKEQIIAAGVDLPSDSSPYCKESDCLALFDDDLYCDKTTVTKQHGLHLKDANEWWNIITNSGLRVYLDLLTLEQQAQLRNEHLQQLETLQTENGIWLDVNVIYTQAKARN